MKDIDVIFPVHNRIYYTQMTLPRVIHECKKSTRFNKLYIYDDMSADGTDKFLSTLDIEGYLGEGNVSIIRQKIGNSVDQTNMTVRNGTGQYLFKVDNDTILPQGTLDHMAKVMDDNQKIGFLGAGYWPRDLFPEIKPDELELIDARFIGGIGMFRKQVFLEMGAIRSYNKFFGFGELQQQAKAKGWEIYWLGGLRVMDLDATESWSMAKYYGDTGQGRNRYGSNSDIMGNIFNGFIKKK